MVDCKRYISTEKAGVKMMIAKGTETGIIMDARKMIYECLQCDKLKDCKASTREFILLFLEENDNPKD